MKLTEWNSDQNVCEHKKKKKIENVSLRKEIFEKNLCFCDISIVQINLKCLKIKIRIVF